MVYLKYLKRAIDDDGIIHNFSDKSGKFIDRRGSDDSIARSFWALAYIAQADIPEEFRKLALELIPAYEGQMNHYYVVPIAYATLGYVFSGDITRTQRLGRILVKRYRSNSESSNWHWFSSEMTYANGIVPYALIKAHELTGEEEFLDVALEATAFAEKVTRYRGIPAPIGQDGWNIRNQRRALYDQQAIEAADMVLLYNELFFLTGNVFYHNKAIEWMGWFFGNNINNMVLYDDVTGGIYDGLTRRGINHNQGAESIDVFLLAYLSFTLPKKLKKPSVSAILSSVEHDDTKDL